MQMSAKKLNPAAVGSPTGSERATTMVMNSDLLGGAQRGGSEKKA
jgi:hypothetical protein